MISSVIKVNPSVVCTQLQNGDSVLLHLDTQMYYSLNPTGVFIWEHLNGKRSIQDVSEALEQKYDISIQDAGKSVSTLINELAEEKLVFVD
jgi:hypothetical protein